LALSALRSSITGKDLGGAIDVTHHQLKLSLNAFREVDMKAKETKLKDIMTMNPDWCVPETSAMKAALIMKQTNVGIVPVLESEAGRKLVGVVTDRDLCLAVIAVGKHPDSVQVGEAMTSDVVTCQPDEDVRKAADLMQENQVRRIPVVDREGILQGIVSTADILQRSNLPSDIAHETLKKVTKPTDHASRPRAKIQRAV
jgi:CBS domain-containing protein